MSKSQTSAQSATRLIVLTSHPIQYQVPLWRAMAERGINFEVWFLTDQGVRRTEDEGFGASFAWDIDLLSGYRHRFLELKGPWNLRKFDGIPLQRPIGETLKEAGASALWTEGWRFKVQWEAVRAAKKLRVPVFLRGETSDKIPEKGGLFGIVRKFLLRRLFGKVDYFLVIGQASRRFYLKYGVAERKLLGAPYCVDNKFFWGEAEKYREDGTTTIREAWNIPEEAKVILFCGKFVEKKRPFDLVAAVKLHLEEFKRKKGELWHLLFVGSGELGKELREACDVRYDAEDQNAKILSSKNAVSPLPSASFVGFLNQSEISKAYAMSDVLVLPSEAWETWGLVVNEATAAGVPTVVSSECGCSEDFEDKNPYTRAYPLGDIGKLRVAIDSVLSISAKPEEVTKFAEYFSSKITVESVLEKVQGF